MTTCEASRGAGVPATRHPKLLDLFCGAGGSAMGFHRAGFDVTGVDICPQPHYPFRFVQADALSVALGGYDVIAASPPCQGYSRCRHMPGRAHLSHSYPRLIPAVRTRLEEWGGLWVIENTPEAPLDRCTTLCGQMFGLGVYRHRRFESNVLLLAPAHTRHRVRIGDGRLSSGYGRGDVVTVAGHMFSAKAGARAMGIDWMTRDELAQAIPPAYTHWIGMQLMRALTWRDPDAGAEQPREEQG